MNPITQVAEKGSTVEETAEKGDEEEAATAAAVDEAAAVATGQQMLSPLSGAYLLVILGEPISEDHKEKMLEKLRKGMFIPLPHVFHLLFRRSHFLYILLLKVGACFCPAISGRSKF